MELDYAAELPTSQEWNGLCPQNSVGFPGGERIPGNERAGITWCCKGVVSGQATYFLQTL